MRWLVGLDLRDRSRGAVRFASWIAAASRGEGGEEILAVHVLEEEHLRMVLRFHHLDEVVAGARSAASAALREEGAAERVREAEVIRGLTAEESLEELCGSRRADALVVGRAAGREGHHWYRLGRVARHLLRDPRVPVVVVPPDVREEHLGGGPVVALTDLAEDAAQACRFAARLAERLGRPLAVVHVVPRPEDRALDYLPAATREALHRSGTEEGERGLAAWIAAQGLRPQIAALLHGPTVEAALSFAEERGAPLLVVGERRLGALARAASTSVSSELAASSPLPVAVVPPLA